MVWRGRGLRVGFKIEVMSGMLVKRPPDIV